MLTAVRVHDCSGVAKAMYYKQGTEESFETLDIRLKHTEIVLFNPSSELLLDLANACHELLGKRKVDRDEDELIPPVGGCDSMTRWSEEVE